jgi:hypothetical protein
MCGIVTAMSFWAEELAGDLGISPANNPDKAMNSRVVVGSLQSTS